MAYSRAKNLMEKYALTPEGYAAMALEQGGVCKCCRRAPTGRDLHVDHDHKVARTKFEIREAQPGCGIWFAVCPRFNHIIEGKSREEVGVEMKRWLLRKSIRGLLCWACNSGIRKFLDKPDLLRSGANYLDEFALSLVQ
jgi:hypothetical protein